MTFQFSDESPEVFSVFDESPAALVKIFSMYCASLSDMAARDKIPLQNLSMSALPATLKNPICCKLSVIVATVESILSSASGVYPA